MLVIWDIDNTLLQSHKIYDEIYRITSSEVIGKEFIMTKNPDGSKDNGFTKLNNKQILEKRLIQLEINSSKINTEYFFEVFDKTALQVVEKYSSYVYPGVRELLENTYKKHDCILLSSGTRKMQTAIMEKAELIQYFKKGLFFGEYETKTQVIEELILRFKPKIVVYLGDSPSDMKTMKKAQTTCKNIAVGVTVCGLVTAGELKKAGADYILNNYDKSSLML